MHFFASLIFWAALSPAAIRAAPRAMRPAGRIRAAPPDIHIAHFAAYGYAIAANRRVSKTAAAQKRSPHQTARAQTQIT